MHWIKPLLCLIVSLAVIILKIGWAFLLYLLDHLDAADSDALVPDDEPIDGWYNARTGEVDPVKRWDGWYVDKC